MADAAEPRHQTLTARVCVVVLPKAAPGERWRRLFRGDPDGARCLEPPYSVMGKSQGGKMASLPPRGVWQRDNWSRGQP